jgi:hypothetical protein
MKRSSFSGTASDAVDAGRCRGNQEAVPFGRGFVMISSDHVAEVTGFVFQWRNQPQFQWFFEAANVPGEMP